MLERLALALASVALGVVPTVAQDSTENGMEIVFEGSPTKSLATGPEFVERKLLTDDESNELRTLIVVDGHGDYFWASREMKPMFRVRSGIYVIYAAENGYVKTYDDEFLNDVRDSDSVLFDPADEYVEHHHFGLAGFNYYGVRRDR